MTISPSKHFHPIHYFLFLPFPQPCVCSAVLLYLKHLQDLGTIELKILGVNNEGTKFDTRYCHMLECSTIECHTLNSRCPLTPLVSLHLPLVAI